MIKSVDVFFSRKKNAFEEIITLEIVFHDMRNHYVAI